MKLEKQMKKAPNKPGVYFFKDIRNRIIYVGKAQNLAARLKSYFASHSETRLAKRKMLEKASRVSWQETVSEIEALILESTLIKKYRPAYNVALRDDKNYFFVGFTKEKFPKIFVTHQPNKNQISKSEKQKYYVGPFTEGASLKTALKTLRKIFPYCTCKIKHKRPCVRAEINKCLGVCCLDEKYHSSFFRNSKERKIKYQKNIQAVKAVLGGKRQSLIKNLKKETLAMSTKMKFEKAEESHRELLALEKIFAHRNFIKREKDYFEKANYYLKRILNCDEIRHVEAYDISNIQGKNAVGSMVTFENNKPDKNRYRRFLIARQSEPNDIAMLKEVLTRRLKHRELPLPDLFLIDGGKAQFNIAEKVLEEQKTLPRPKIAAIAKRQEELHTEYGIFPLKKMPRPLLHFIQYLRNEAHRFAIQYHKLRRQKSLFVKDAK